MKIVIDIDENTYKNTLIHGGNSNRLIDAVRNATPLTECEDAISREKVLDIVCGCYYENDFGESNFYREIEALPSVQPKAKTGKWIERHEPFTWMGYTDYVCSICGKETKSRMNFFPDCGADMRGKK